MATVDSRSLYQRSRAHHRRVNDQCGLGHSDLAHSPMLHIEAPNANVAENRSGSRLRHRYFVSTCQSTKTFLLRCPFIIKLFHSTCITSILRTIASFRLAREADVTYEMVSVSLWSSVNPFLNHGQVSHLLQKISST